MRKQSNKKVKEKLSLAQMGVHKMGKSDHFSFRLHTLFILYIAVYCVWLDIYIWIYSSHSFTYQNTKTDTPNLANILYALWRMYVLFVAKPEQNQLTKRKICLVWLYAIFNMYWESERERENFRSTTESINDTTYFLHILSKKITLPYTRSHIHKHSRPLQCIENHRALTKTIDRLPWIVPFSLRETVRSDAINRMRFSMNGKIWIHTTTMSQTYHYYTRVFVLKMAKMSSYKHTNARI